jgi:NAD(P)H-flavin reductase
MIDRNENKDIYLPQLATLKKRKMMNGTELYMLLEMDEGKLEYEPGQFLEVSLGGIGEAPISISSSPTQSDGFELVVRKAGRVTKAIHNMKVGDKIGIRGPYGSGYPLDELKGENLVFICGGIGLVPQRSLINYVLDNRDEFGELTVIQGTKCHTMRFFREELSEWDKSDKLEFHETVDEQHECWNGNVGVVTTLIPKIEKRLANAKVLVCGPPIMYKFVLLSLDECEVPHDQIFVNLERRMECGVGKCGHCQINGSYVCQDGPVYRYSELSLVPEAIQ